eukprot:CAMPEP_0183471886 /NCGR_PEP_ID=MMETSP0370-20130417/158595_1 /TAXON_ID=268820 /ORGANISM="Peridinium aciculiferum, Strain PAER-2" /LENGTH=82 /DNA_ID=CAMNT_0025664487 /DNA_START=68 /DNA_END=313 /DNA_ORIENTATION=+
MLLAAALGRSSIRGDLATPPASLGRIVRRKVRRLKLPILFDALVADVELVVPVGAGCAMAGGHHRPEQDWISASLLQAAVRG